MPTRIDSEGLVFVDGEEPKVGARIDVLQNLLDPVAYEVITDICVDGRDQSDPDASHEASLTNMTAIEGAQGPDQLHTAVPREDT